VPLAVLLTVTARGGEFLVRGVWCRHAS
jgi:hypothetical protein